MITPNTAIIAEDAILSVHSLSMLQIKLLLDPAGKLKPSPTWHRELRLIVRLLAILWERSKKLQLELIYGNVALRKI